MQYSKNIIIGIALLFTPNIGHLILAFYNYGLGIINKNEVVSESLSYDQYVNILITSEIIGKFCEYGILLLVLTYIIDEIIKNGTSNLFKQFSYFLLFFTVGQLMYFITWILPLYDYVH